MRGAGEGELAGGRCSKGVNEDPASSWPREAGRRTIWGSGAEAEGLADGEVGKETREPGRVRVHEPPRRQRGDGRHAAERADETVSAGQRRRSVCVSVDSGSTGTWPTRTTRFTCPHAPSCPALDRRRRCTQLDAGDLGQCAFPVPGPTGGNCARSGR